MKTYKEQIENKTNLVLVNGNNIMGTFGNLRKVVKFMEHENFPSYWTIIRKKGNPIICKNYAIFKVKHY